MDERQRAVLKDRFLGYSLDRSNYFGVKEFQKKFPRLISNPDDLNLLVQEIIDHDANLLDTLSANGSPIFLLCSKPFARTFLNRGGFIALYDKEEEDWKSLFRHLWKNNTPSKLQGTGLKRNDLAPHKRDRYHYMFVIMSILSFCYVLYDIFERIHKWF
ncbi:MAG: hypothetical protein WBG90_14230 [Saonia sp.]